MNETGTTTTQTENPVLPWEHIVLGETFGLHITRIELGHEWPDPVYGVELFRCIGRERLRRHIGEVEVHSMPDGVRAVAWWEGAPEPVEVRVKFSDLIDLWTWLLDVSIEWFQHRRSAAD